MKVAKKYTNALCYYPILIKIDHTHLIKGFSTFFQTILDRGRLTF